MKSNLASGLKFNENACVNFSSKKGEKNVLCLQFFQERVRRNGGWEVAGQEDALVLAAFYEGMCGVAVLSWKKLS